ncbi:MAG: hypothetical protein ACOZBL_03850 [Patescibacteria group bacterium]
MLLRILCFDPLLRVLIIINYLISVVIKSFSVGDANILIATC